MSNGLTLDIEREGAQRFMVRGEITEEADFSAVLTQANEQVVLNLAGVQRINSCGVREWIKFLSALGEKSGNIELEQCSPVMVRQLSMIATMRGVANVTSILVPYFCEGCDGERTVLVQVTTGQPPAIEKTARCPTCSDEMDLDDTPDSYVAFTAINA